MGHHHPPPDVLVYVEGGGEVHRGGGGGGFRPGRAAAARAQAADEGGGGGADHGDLERRERESSIILVCQRGLLSWLWHFSWHLLGNQRSWLLGHQQSFCRKDPAEQIF